jgi:predicted PurR-regulated permease PerM
MDSLDIVLVGSLALLAFISLIFLVFMIPVLIQLAKTLEAIKNLINTYREYSEGFGKSLDQASKNFQEFGGYTKNLGLGILAGIRKFFSKK